MGPQDVRSRISNNRICILFANEEESQKLTEKNKTIKIHEK